MDNLYSTTPQATYRGRTAGHYVRSAKVVQSNAGDWGIITPSLPRCWLVLTDGGHVVIDSGCADDVVLVASGRAIEKLEALTRRADRLMMADA